MICIFFIFFYFCRCCRCPSQRCRLCVKILRPASALSSASRRVPTLTSCSPSKFRSPYPLESQVSQAKYCSYYWKRGLSHQSCLVWINCGFLSSAYKPHINKTVSSSCKPSMVHSHRSKHSRCENALSVPTNSQIPDIFVFFLCTIFLAVSLYFNVSENNVRVAAGHNADRSCLHLLHGDPSAQNWTDVTSQVSLELTHLYAVFYIKNFSW